MLLTSLLVLTVVCAGINLFRAYYSIWMIITLISLKTYVLFWSVFRDNLTLSDSQHFTIFDLVFRSIGTFCSFYQLFYNQRPSPPEILTYNVGLLGLHCNEKIHIV